MNGSIKEIPKHVCGVPHQSETRWRRFKKFLGLGKSKNNFEDDLDCIWLVTPVSWKVGPITSDLSRTKIELIISKAFRTWESAGSGFIADEYPSSGSADITFGWYNSRRKKELMGNTAFAYFPCSEKPGHVYFNIDEVWTEDFLFKFALHEIGHAIGLQADTFSPDVMQSSPDQSDGVLSSTDLDRVSALYPSQRSNDNDDAIA